MWSVARIQCSGVSMLSVLQSSKKACDEFLGVLADADAGRGGVGDDAVVHVGEVHDVVELEAAEFQEAAQDVLEHEGAVVADVREVVDRGTAGVDADFASALRDERLGLTTESVVEADFGHG